MPAPAFLPLFSPPGEVVPVIVQRGYALLNPQGVSEVSGCSIEALDALRPSWDGLPPDTYLKDGGRYRRRRHACYVVAGDEVAPTPPRPHWQPVEYNALHGGMNRWFEPVDPAVAGSPAWRGLIGAIGRVCSALRAASPGAIAAGPWSVEAHQFRIDTTDGIGRPTPEGAHRDGVDFVAVILVAREGILGGETRVFEAAGPNGQRFTLTQPWSLLLLDDARVIHESTPIRPLGEAGHRDTLVLTYRAGGFQDEG
jgi:hypothetical protein